MNSVIYHGGNLEAARARFGEPRQGWLDLSTGINPVAYPVGDLPLQDWTRLPSRAAEAELESIAARRYRLQDASRLIAAPGTQAIIQALPRLIRARSVAILGFTYQEHQAAWRAAGAGVRLIETLADAETDGADVVVVVNPNNPDGRLISVADLLVASSHLARRGGFLIVDEAFMDVLDPELSLLPLLPDDGIIVLRSFGKTWGLAGVRLGFMAGPARRVADLCAYFGPWAVSGPALTIGQRALADDAWLAATIKRLHADCAAFDAIAQTAGLEIVGGTPLYRLTRHPNAHTLFDRLGRAGILVRPFPDRPEWLRFGIPATDRDRTRLREALA